MARQAVSNRYRRWVATADGADRLRSRFRRLNQAMVILWRLGLGPLFGRWPRTAGTILVLHHTGRRTGRRYRTPVNYAEVDGEIYCVAGFGPTTDWYRNLLARPTTEVWLPDGRWTVAVEDLGDRPDRVTLIRHVVTASGFAAPLFGLHPRRMTDEELGSVTHEYCLVHIRRVSRLSGGVADLAWLWSIPLLWGGLHRLRSRRCRAGGSDRAGIGRTEPA